MSERLSLLDVDAEGALEEAAAAFEGDNRADLLAAVRATGFIVG